MDKREQERKQRQAEQLADEIELGELWPEIPTRKAPGTFLKPSEDLEDTGSY